MSGDPKAMPIASAEAIDHPVTAPDSARSVPGERPPVDAERIQELRDLDGDDSPEFLRELVTVFVDVIVPGGLQALDQAIARLDPTAAERAAHGLRSSALNLGAGPASDLCASIEAIGRKGGMGGIAALHGRLREELVQRVCPALAMMAGRS